MTLNGVDDTLTTSTSLARGGNAMARNNQSAARGRREGYRKPRPAPRERPPSVADLAAWCADGDFSRTWVYGEWAQGRGPKRVRIGGKVKILETPREYCERVARQQGISR